MTQYINKTHKKHVRPIEDKNTLGQYLMRCNDVYFAPTADVETGYLSVIPQKSELQ